MYFFTVATISIIEISLSLSSLQVHIDKNVHTCKQRTQISKQRIQITILYEFIFCDQNLRM